MKKYLTKGSIETKNLGTEFASTLKEKDVVLLYGDLGCGKTTFAQGVAKGLGIKDRILSPTFILVRQYEIPHPTPRGGRARTRNLYHVDLYRIQRQTDIVDLGFEEIINEERSITIIEWADRLLDFKLNEGLLGRQVYKIYFKHLNGDKREITIEDYGWSR